MQSSDLSLANDTLLAASLNLILEIRCLQEKRQIELKLQFATREIPECRTAGGVAGCGGYFFSLLPKLQVSLRSTPPHLSSKCTWSSNPVSLEIRHRVFSGFGASRKSWCQERALAAPVLPPDYILPKTYLRVGLLARVSPSGPFCVASRRYGLVSVSELFWKQAESRDRRYRVVAGASHGF